MPRLLHSSARVLEFDAVRDLLSAYASSELGRREIADLHPQTDREQILRQEQLTAEVRNFLRGGSSFGFHGLVDPGALLDKAQISGATLETIEIRDILIVVDRASQWRGTAMNPPASMPTGWPAVRELAERIADFTPLLGFFKNKILPDGTLDDKASPELARIRREIEKQKRQIPESLRGYLRRLAEGGAVQDELITIRGERFVIPVKIGRA